MSLSTASIEWEHCPECGGLFVQGTRYCEFCQKEHKNLKEKK